MYIAAQYFKTTKMKPTRANFRNVIDRCGLRIVKEMQ